MMLTFYKDFKKTENYFTPAVIPKNQIISMRGMSLVKLQMEDLTYL